MELLEVSREVNNAVLQLLYYRYEQIVEVNLTSRYCRVIWPEVDPPAESSCYLDELWESDRLYASELKTLRRFRDAEYVKNRLTAESSISYKFKRKQDNGNSEWVQIEIVKDRWYSADNVSVLFFIKNIEESYGKEYKARKHAEHLAKFDSLTHYYNRLEFDKYSRSCSFHSLGIVYIDLNGLKTINDSKGHAAGDKYIKECCSKIDIAFSDCDKYRIGGDEFVIVAADSNFSRFNANVMHFNRLIDTDGLTMPVCSIGWSWTDSSTSSSSFSDLITTAEKKMYICKELDYLKYHADRRRH